MLAFFNKFINKENEFCLKYINLYILDRIHSLIKNKYLSCKTDIYFLSENEFCLVNIT